MFLRNAIKPVLRYKSLTASRSARNAARFQNQQKCVNLLTTKLRQFTSSLTTKESSQGKPNHRSLLFFIVAASRGISLFPNLLKKNRTLLKVSKIQGLRPLTTLHFTDTEGQPPGTYKKDSHHEKVLAEQQRQLEELKKKKEGFFTNLDEKPEFPKYKPKD